MSNRIWIGLVMLFAGVGILLHQLDVWDFGYILRTWWPLILIIIGALQLARRNNDSPIVSWILIFIGGVFLLNQWTNVNLTTFIWPLILIFIGFIIIFSRAKPDQTLDSKHSIDSLSLFSGTNHRSESTSFQGGNVLTIFGSTEIDLRDAIIAKDGAILDLTTIFGGIEIIIPENVRIEVSGLPIFGGWEDNTRRASNDSDAPLIKIKCLTIFGGVEIKD